MAFSTQPAASGSDVVNYHGTAEVDQISFGGQGPLKVNIKGFEASDNINAAGTSFESSFLNGNAGADDIRLALLSNSRALGGADGDYLRVTNLSSSRVNGNKGIDDLRVTASSNGSVNGGQGNDTISLGGAHGYSFVFGDIGNDAITLENGSQFDRVALNGNAGNDTVTVQNVSLLANSTNIRGGAGNDRLTAAASAVAVNFLGDNGDDTLIGSTAGDTFSGGNGADNLQGNNGADSLSGNSGDDFFIYTATAEATGDTFVGGDGGQTNGDALLVQTGNVDFTNLTTATVLTAGGIERIQIEAARTATFIGTQLTGQAISINGTSAAGNSTLNVDLTTAGTIDLSSLTFTAVGSGTVFGTGADIVDIDSAAGVATKVTGTSFEDDIDGNTGADSLNGGGGTDTIAGAAGNDTFDGGAGIDNIDMGANADQLNTTSGDAANRDVITNFTVNTDILGISAALTSDGTVVGANAVIEDEATAAANTNGAAYNLAGALAANTDAIDLVTLDSDVLDNDANADLSAATDGTELLKALVDTGVGSTASGITVDGAGHAFYIATVDAGNGYLYHVNSGADTTVTATEIALVGTFTGSDIAGLTAGATLLMI